MLITELVVVADPGHAASAAEFGMVAAQKFVPAIELPPGQIHVHSANAIVIMGRHALQLRKVSAGIAAYAIH